MHLLKFNVSFLVFLWGQLSLLLSLLSNTAYGADDTKGTTQSRFPVVPDGSLFQATVERNSPGAYYTELYDYGSSSRSYEYEESSTEVPRPGSNRVAIPGSVFFPKEHFQGGTTEDDNTGRKLSDLLIAAGNAKGISENLDKTEALVYKAESAVPKTESKVAKTESAVPKTESAVPDAVPKAVTSVPKTVTLVPKTVTLVPKTVTLVPKTVTSVPTTVTLVPKTVTSVPKTVTSEPKTLTSVPGGKSGISSQTTARTTPPRTFKPSPSYYRPAMKPPTPGISTTFRPAVSTGTAPGIPVPMKTSTLRPAIITTQPSTSTTVPVSESDDDDDDVEEEEEDTPGNSTFNPEGAVGRSLFLGPIKRRSKSKSVSPAAGTADAPRKTGVTPVRPGARAMKLEEDPNVVTDFVFSDIKCYKRQDKEFFGASIHMKSGYHVPYIRDRPQDPLTSSDCRMERLEAPDVRYRIAATDLRACGVEQCGDSLCLTMVFPRVPTLALAEDEVTTIKCLPQKSSISETQTISFSGDNLATRRSSSTVEGGGQDFAAEVGIFRQNPGGASNGLFAQRVNSGGVVQLGEPLQLRSVVRGGDGWIHSKLTDIKVWRMSEGYVHNRNRLIPNDASEVITLVDAQGCRNPEYEMIADSHPLKDPRNNLVHHFTFRAFLFRGQRATEPLIVTAKVQACQEAGECRLSDCRSNRSSPADPNIQRFKRTAIEHHQNASSIIQNYDTQMSLRVVGRDHPTSIPDKDFVNAGATSTETEPNSFSCAEKMAFTAAGGAGIMLFLCLVGSSLIFYSIKNRRLAPHNNDGDPEIKPGLAESPHSQKSEGDRIRKRDKPLPPPPVDYEQVGLPVGNSLRSHSKSEMKRTYQHCTNNPDGCIYECITETRDKKSRKSEEEGEDGVLIVYYCNNKDKKKGGSTSAPSSVRSKKRSRTELLNRFQSPEDHEDTEESEEGFDSNEKSRPRTVRDVKRSHHHHHHHKSRSSGIRRRLSSIYREVYGIRYRGGSIPARISAKSASSRRGKTYFRDRNEIYAGSLSQSSDLDSAYCESVCSKHIEGGNCTRNCGATRRQRHHHHQKPHRDHRKYDKDTNHVYRKDGPKLLPDHSNPPGKAFNPISRSSEILLLSGPETTPPALPPKSQHFVTRNEDSTQILILPETNV